MMILCVQYTNVPIRVLIEYQFGHVRNFILLKGSNKQLMILIDTKNVFLRPQYMYKNVPFRVPIKY